MKLGLGDYWKCLHRDQSKTIPTFLERFDQFKVMDNADFVPTDCANKWDLAIPMMLTGSTVDVIAWVTANEESKACLASIYPTITDGASADMVVEGQTAWPENLEGLVHARLGNQPISFFDALFPISRERYVAGETARFKVAAFGSSIHKLSAIAERMGGSPKFATAISEVFATGRGFLLPIHDEEGVEDRYLLTGRFSHVEHETVGEMRLFRTDVALANGLVLPLIFGQTSIDTNGWVPEDGDFVASVIFLQGYREALALHPSER